MKILLIGGLGNQLFQLTSSHLINNCQRVICQLYMNPSQKQNFGDLNILLSKFRSQFLIQEIKLNFIQRKVTNLSIRACSKVNPRRVRISNKVVIKALELCNDIFIEKSSKTHISKGAVPIEFPPPTRILRIIGYLQTSELLENTKCTCGFIDALLNFLNENSAETGFKHGVALHVRLGDYEKDRSFVRLGIDYYKSAFQWITMAHQLSEVELYSNDIENSLELLTQIGVDNVSVPTSSEDSGLTVVRSLSQHSSFIIANSTLSWWGAYASRSKPKIVIAPRSWFNNAHPDDNLFPKSWIRL